MSDKDKLRSLIERRWGDNLIVIDVPCRVREVLITGKRRSRNEDMSSKANYHRRDAVPVMVVDKEDSMTFATRVIMRKMARGGYSCVAKVKGDVPFRGHEDDWTKAYGTGIRSLDRRAETVDEAVNAVRSHVEALEVTNDWYLAWRWPNHPLTKKAKAAWEKARGSAWLVDDEDVEVGELEWTTG